MNKIVVIVILIVLSSCSMRIEVDTPFIKAEKKVIIKERSK